MSSLKVHNTHYRYTQTLTITAGAYSANDVVGGLITIPCGPGTLRKAKIVDADSEGAALDLYLFYATPDLEAADNEAFAATVADLTLLEERIRFEAANYVTVASADDYCMGTLNSTTSLGVECRPTDGVYMYAYLVCTGTPTYTATTDLTLELLFWQDRAG
jgi:hypothetical protein